MYYIHREPQLPLPPHSLQMYNCLNVARYAMLALQCVASVSPDTQTHNKEEEFTEALQTLEAFTRKL